MISRRAFLKASVAAAGLASRHPGAWAGDLDEERVRREAAAGVGFEVPAGACDCHVHVFGPPRQFPFWAGRVYTPPPATVDNLLALQRTLGLDRVVVVQPSVYGTDNACTLDALRRLGGRARGVAVIDPSASAASLVEMARTGVRGIRVNLVQGGIADPVEADRRLAAGMALARERSWHVQVFCQGEIVEAVAERVAGSPVPVVFDHFGGAVAARGLRQPGFAALLELVRGGHAYVKISGAAELLSSRAPDFPDVRPFVRALVEANPGRILWGSNWPHPDSRKIPGRRPYDLAPPLPVDDTRVMGLLADWVPDGALRRRILVENPAELYGF